MARKRSGGAKAKKPQPNIAPTSSVDDVDVGNNGSGYSNGHYYRNGKNGSGSDNSGNIPIWMKRVAVMIAIISIFHKTLWPWGIAVPLSSSTERSNYASIDYTNDSLMSKHGKLTKLYERTNGDDEIESLMKGPETILFGNDGTLYALTEEGKLISLTDLQEVEVEEEESSNNSTAKTEKIMTGKSTLIADLGVGRPLGGKFHPKEKNTLYIADAHLGLIRLKLDDTNNGGGKKNKKKTQNRKNQEEEEDVITATSAPIITPTTKKNKVELIASRVYDQGQWTQILYANDVVIGPKTGMVYFTDSTDIAPDRIGTRTWDTMYGAKSDLLRGKRTGRLLQYNPETEEVSVLARDLFFPNGISINKDETAIYFAETFALQLMKYNIRDGSLTIVVDAHEHTGYTDGLDCSWKGITGKSSHCYSVIVSPVVPLMKLAWLIPHPFDIVFRSFLMSLPKKLAPPVKPYGGIIEFKDDDSKSGSGMTRIIQDPTGKDVGMINGVTVYNNKLYLGSLYNDYITIYDLD